MWHHEVKGIFCSGGNSGFAAGHLQSDVYARGLRNSRARAIELPANFVASVNADMKVGALEETITVTGQTPLVDVTQAARTQVVTCDMLDTLPISRHFMSVTTMTPGIRFQVPDIGGSRQMEQTYPRYNQLDLNFKKNFRAGRKTFSGQVDLFNALNGNTIFARQSTVGNALGDVTTILQGRLIRWAFQMKF
jgi:hypothetical protein